MLVTYAFLLFPVATAVWASHKLRRVDRAVAMDQAFSKMDTLISKIQEMGGAIRATGVRGRHAAECLAAMGDQIQLVSECTEQFMKETRE